MRDVLHYAGLEDTDPNVKHIQVRALDFVLRRKSFHHCVELVNVDKTVGPHSQISLHYHILLNIVFDCSLKVRMLI